MPWVQASCTENFVDIRSKTGHRRRADKMRRGGRLLMMLCAVTMLTGCCCSSVQYQKKWFPGPCFWSDWNYSEWGPGFSYTKVPVNYSPEEK